MFPGVAKPKNRRFEFSFEGPGSRLLHAIQSNFPTTCNEPFIPSGLSTRTTGHSLGYSASIWGQYHSRSAVGCGDGLSQPNPRMSPRGHICQPSKTALEPNQGRQAAPLECVQSPPPCPGSEMSAGTSGGKRQMAQGQYRDMAFW